MTKSEAHQITSQAEDLAEIHPTHEIAGDLRAAKARLRHAARSKRDAMRVPVSMNVVENQFAALFAAVR